MQKIGVLSLFLMLILGSLKAQMPDSVLDIKTYLNWVKVYHPTAKQAFLLNRTAEAGQLAARGGFDPKLYGDFDQKFFDSKTYYTQGEYGLKVPTWFGLEVKGAYLTSEGSFLNPENKIPKQGQAVLGVSMPLLQGLMIDERRAGVRQAQQDVQMFNIERRLLLNDLTFEATQQYWKWAFAYEQKRIFEQALNVAEVRFNALKVAYEQGDKMAMDTLEAFIQWQDRQYQYLEVAQDYRNAVLKFANFLWRDNNMPLPFRTDWRPVAETPLSIFANVPPLDARHPFLQVYDVKMRQLDIEKRLKQEKFKPKLNIQYNLLGTGWQPAPFVTDNYKWGIQFSSSTLFRTERGNLQKTMIKIGQTELAREQKALEIQTKIEQARTERDNLLAQKALYEQTTANYKRLWELELTRFELGESSLFLVNSREMKYIEAQVKLAKIKTELETATAAILWAEGRLSD